MQIIIETEDANVEKLSGKMYANLIGLYECTPLQKGHGDLIDINNLYYRKNDITQKIDFYAPVIIKADVESNQ